MNKQIIIIIICAALGSQAYSQSQLKLGLGYFGENAVHPGAVLEFELDRSYTENFSLPLRADIGFHTNSDFTAYTIDIHKGFRKYFRSGLFIEQSLGFGLIAKSFKEDTYYYADKYFSVIVHGNKTVMGLMPSATIGLGYDLSAEKDRSSLLWIRPKVYWDLGYRSLHLPYGALQIGYSKTIKTK